MKTSNDRILATPLAVNGHIAGPKLKAPAEAVAVASHRPSRQAV